MTYYWATHGFFGGHIALDFINTVDDDGKSRHQNAIPDWSAVFEWCQSSGLLTAGGITLLKSKNDPGKDEDELVKLLQLRELSWCVIRDVVQGSDAEQSKLDEFTKAIQWSMTNARLIQQQKSLNLEAEISELGKTVVRARIGLALNDLISNIDLGRIRECGRCTGLFFNQGRGVGRRWCRMATCGNRAKSQTFRRKS
ncbi:MAG: hypothetical protein GY763_06125 [Gammaproteobacteria bacterium]|nr:hypothetical protein [Gammaproteobacteria bacterium]